MSGLEAGPSGLASEGRAQGAGACFYCRLSASLDLACFKLESPGKPKKHQTLPKNTKTQQNTEMTKNHRRTPKSNKKGTMHETLTNTEKQ